MSRMSEMTAECAKKTADAVLEDYAKRHEPYVDKHTKRAIKYIDKLIKYQSSHGYYNCTYIMRYDWRVRKNIVEHYMSLNYQVDWDCYDTLFSEKCYFEISWK